MATLVAFRRKVDRQAPLRLHLTFGWDYYSDYGKTLCGHLVHFERNKEYFIMSLLEVIEKVAAEPDTVCTSCAAMLFHNILPLKQKVAFQMEQEEKERREHESCGQQT
jgi:hypothetical protein